MSFFVSAIRMVGMSPRDESDRKKTLDSRGLNTLGYKDSHVHDLDPMGPLCIRPFVVGRKEAARITSET